MGSFYKSLLLAASELNRVFFKQFLLFYIMEKKILIKKYKYQEARILMDEKSTGYFKEKRKSPNDFISIS